MLFKKHFHFVSSPSSLWTFHRLTKEGKGPICIKLLESCASFSASFSLRFLRRFVNKKHTKMNSHPQIALHSPTFRVNSLTLCSVHRWNITTLPFSPRRSGEVLQTFFGSFRHARIVRGRLAVWNGDSARAHTPQSSSFEQVILPFTETS